MLQQAKSPPADPKRKRVGEEVVDWNLAFFPARSRYWKWWIPGKYKHVSAFAFAPGCNTWIIFDFSLLGGSIHLLPATDEGITMMADWAFRATIVACPAATFSDRKFLFGLACVPAMQHLTNIGVRSFTPSGLLRRLLKSGAEVTHGVTVLNGAHRG